MEEMKTQLRANLLREIIAQSQQSNFTTAAPSLLLARPFNTAVASIVTSEDTGMHLFGYNRPCDLRPEDFSHSPLQLRWHVMSPILLCMIPLAPLSLETFWTKVKQNFLCPPIPTLNCNTSTSILKSRIILSILEPRIILGILLQPPRRPSSLFLLRPRLIAMFFTRLPLSPMQQTTSVPLLPRMKSLKTTQMSLFCTSSSQHRSFSPWSSSTMPHTT